VFEAGPMRSHIHLKPQPVSCMSQGAARRQSEDLPASPTISTRFEMMPFPGPVRAHPPIAA